MRDLLSKRRVFLNLAVLCITESIRENPEKYRHLVHQEHEPSVIGSTTSDFNPFWIYGQSNFQSPRQESKIYFIEDYVAMVSEDGNKLMEKIIKELGKEILSDYHPSKSSRLLSQYLC